MPYNDVIDESYTSGNPTKTGIPMIQAPKLVPWYEGFVDVGTTLAIAGQLVVLQAAAANLGGGNFLKSSVAAQVLLRGEYGIVTTPASSAQSATGACVKQGVVPALCITTGTAIAVGTLLAADGAGNLTVAPTTPTPGQLLARSLGVLASSTSTPTLVLVYVGHA
jgi:hypothetical protein